METLLTREECRKIQIEILDEIYRICKEHGLTCYLAYGSLLGAVRHQGFIPWDDDIDLAMGRDEYEKLISILRNKTEKKASWLNVLDGETPGYYYTFAKAVDCRTVAKMADNLTEHGIWVDIFPLDGLPENEKNCRRFLKKCYFLRGVVLSMTTDFTGMEKGKKTLVKRILNWLGKVAGKERVHTYYEKLCRTYDYSNAEYVGMLFSPYGTGERMEKSRLMIPAAYSFEEKEYTGYKDYDYYLSHLYGDYMKLPPEDKRRTHRVHAYRKAV